MTPTLLEKLIFAIGGGFITLVAAYFALGKSISGDLAHIKGQFSILLKQLDALDKLKAHAVEHGKDLVKVKSDVDHAHDKIRSIERSLANGTSDHG